MSRTYRGRRDRLRNTVTVTVTVDRGMTYVLNPEASQKLKNLWPAGFACGHSGSGAAQLALGLLYDALDNARKALELYPSFLRDVVARLGDEWEITGDQVLDWLAGRWLDATQPPAAEPDAPEGERGYL
jgi:hypothetical protein